MSMKSLSDGGTRNIARLRAGSGNGRRARSRLGARFAVCETDKVNTL
jgi:hypothetical protein